MTDFPLTPAEAIAAAALITTHAAEKKGLPSDADLLPRWRGWADRLRRWGEANLTPDLEDDAPAWHCTNLAHVESWYTRHGVSMCAICGTVL
jgi:hypothetical protein